jgi:hypothetical protein
MIKPKGKVKRFAAFYPYFKSLYKMKVGAGNNFLSGFTKQIVVYALHPKLSARRVVKMGQPNFLKL